MNKSLSTNSTFSLVGSSVSLQASDGCVSDESCQGFFFFSNRDLGCKYRVTPQEHGLIPCRALADFYFHYLEKKREKKDGSFRKTKHLPIPSASI